MPRKDLHAEMSVLDRDNGGIFPVLQRSIVEGVSVLIVSYGGTGSDALEVIKNNLERYVAEDEREKCIRLLAIDTSRETRQTVRAEKDPNGQVVMRPIDRFTDREFLWLDNAPARAAVDLYNADSGMKQWINPQLPAAIRANPGWLNGSGASSTRQLGRVLLYPQQTVQRLQNKITTLVKEITDNTDNKLKVFIVSGISGGTGSGIVVDASYLIRSFIEPLPGGVGKRTEYCGFLLLPPTGLSSNEIDISKGNRNGIAALKEIDHFMTIGFRGEEYAVNFGGRRIVSKENIFTTCYLIDGVQTGVPIGNKRAKANEVVADCMVDMLTSQPAVAAAGQTVQNVDAFMSDAAAYAVSMVPQNSEHRAPRNANYVYCALGHGKTLIPIELLKAYVAKEVFDAVYQKFCDCGRVNSKDVEEFIKEVWVEPFNPREQQKKIMNATSASFKNKGPFYAVNLLGEVARAAAEKYKSCEQRALQLPGKKQLTLNNYGNIQAQTRELNNRYFNTYVLVMEEMRKYLSDQHDVICTTRLLENYGGSTYTFTPIRFDKLDAGANQVRVYMDNLVNNKNVKAQIARGLLAEMAENRDEWTQLETADSTSVPRFDAAVRIRRFWQEQIDEIVSATLEDLLIKYYAQNPNASYQEVMTNTGPVPTAASVQYLTAAAAAIVNEMWGGAGVAKPLAELETQILPDNNFNGHNYFLVPKSAPHLREYIEAALKNMNIENVTVCESFANDRISCYSQFTGLPGFMFTWVKRAEPDYEAALQAATPGLHMSETKGGERWQNYPNLLVEGIWDRLSNPPYQCVREAAIDRQAEDYFNRARALGMTVKHALANNAAVGEYAVFTLPKELRPDEYLFKDVDTEKPGTPAYTAAEERLVKAVEEKAQQLFDLVDWKQQAEITGDRIRAALESLPAAPVVFREQELSFVNGVMTPLIDQANPQVPEGWEEKLAAQLMRTWPAYMFEVRGSVLVLERLCALVSSAQNESKRLRAFAHFLSADLFAYNPDYLQWYYIDGLREVTLLQMFFGVDEQQNARYYFLYQSFADKYDEVAPVLLEKYRSLMNGATIPEQIAKQKEMKSRATALAAEVETSITPDRNRANQAEILTSQAFRTAAAKRGYDADAIVAFYTDLLGELQLVPDPGF